MSFLQKGIYALSRALRVQSCERWLDVDVFCDPSHGSQSNPLCLKFLANKKTMPEPQPFWTFWIDQRCLKSKDFACTCFDRDLLWYIAKWQANCNKSLILGLPSCRFISQCSWMTALNTTKCYRSEHRTFQNKTTRGERSSQSVVLHETPGFIIQKSRGGCHNLQAVYLIDVWDHNVTVRGERWCGPANMLVI